MSAFEKCHCIIGCNNKIHQHSRILLLKTPHCFRREFPTSSLRPPVKWTVCWVSLAHWRQLQWQLHWPQSCWIHVMPSECVCAIQLYLSKCYKMYSMSFYENVVIHVFVLRSGSNQSLYCDQTIKNKHSYLSSICLPNPRPIASTSVSTLGSS